MKNLIKISLLSMLAAFISSCAGLGSTTTQSQTSADSRVYFGYTEWKDNIPKTIDNAVKPQKQGQACAMNIANVVAIGDSSIETAKNNGKIKKVSFVDTNYKSLTIFAHIYQRGCTVVWGE